jgi:AcrR family transcriptional regulator
VTAGEVAVGVDEGARRRELLDAAYHWVLDHGLADVSLHPLAAAIGVSPGVLLARFGSTEGLVRALLGRSRADQLRVLEGLPDDAGLAAVAEGVWRWLSAREHRPLLRLWLDAYSRSVTGEPGPWAGFAVDHARGGRGARAGARRAARVPAGPARDRRRRAHGSRRRDPPASPVRGGPRRGGRGRVRSGP